MSIKTLLAASAVLCLAGAATAQTPPAPPAGHEHHGAPVTKADFMRHAHDMFAKLDANHDGKITADELTQDRTEMREAMRNKMFDRLDTNHDGSISRAEFDAAHAGRGSHEAGADRASAPAGDMGARHGPGGPGMAGMRGGHGRMGPGGHMGGDFIKRFDANGDGVVTEAEFMGKMEEHFAKADKNGDGTITPDERGHHRGPGKSHAPGDATKDNHGGDS